MEKSEIQFINKKLYELCSTTHCNETLLSYLISKDVLSDNDLEDLVSFQLLKIHVYN